MVLASWWVGLREFLEVSRCFFENLAPAREFGLSVRWLGLMGFSWRFFHHFHSFFQGFVFFPAVFVFLGIQLLKVNKRAWPFKYLVSLCSWSPANGLAIHV